MSDDDYIAALNQAVKQEVISRYLFERRLVEEEIGLLFEEVSALHGLSALLGRRLEELAAALVSRRAARQFFELAGLGQPPRRADDTSPRWPREKGFTRLARYRRLIRRLYDDIYRTDQEIAENLERLSSLLEEVNHDIRHFEKNHDLMSLASYLRSLDLAELQRRKIMGVNFTAWESETAAAALSFKPVDLQSLGLEDTVIHAREPGEVMRAAEDLLRRVCKNHPREVDALFLSRRELPPKNG